MSVFPVLVVFFESGLTFILGDEHLDSLFAALDETIKGGADKGKGKAGDI